MGRGFATATALCALLTACGASEGGASGFDAFRSSAVVRHQATGFEFPPAVAGFERTDVQVFDREGLDMGVSYARRDLGILITVYVYPIPPEASGASLEEHFALCRSQIVEVHGDAVPVAEGPVRIAPGGRAREGLRAVYSFREGGVDLRSALHLFAEGPFYVKYRVTYPALVVQGAEPAVRAFIEALAWP